MGALVRIGFEIAWSRCWHKSVTVVMAWRNPSSREYRASICMGMEHKRLENNKCAVTCRQGLRCSFTENVAFQPHSSKRNPVGSK